MDLLKALNNYRINGISIYYVIDALNNSSQYKDIPTTSVVLNNKYINTLNLKCIREYYKDPLTNKKVKITSTNKCFCVKKAFSISDNNHYCSNCHRIMANKLFHNEAILLKKC